ncbi:hypothetical protein [Acinetobacter haemolyticus]|uniref:hypothetical protein n=1 Tax=Acinetobacter haemolyticus TaxID=29430 RepID=UPI000DE9F17B|nr:hypothetical protein [Acinetobacter haemolyticus]WHR57446.1 hypothetical protein PGW89_13630 [Acinetobacter haemolyticus]
MGVIGTIVVIFVVLFLISVFAQVEHDNELENKKKKDDLELQKKQKEYELELKRKAGLDPLYQEQMRKNKQYKAMIACLIFFIVLIVGYLIVSKSDSRSEADYGTSSIDDEINTLSQEESSIGQENPNLSERFTPIVANKHVESTPSEIQPVAKPREIVEPTVANSFEGNMNDTNLSSSSQISIYEADAHIGENTTVCGEVSQISQTAKATYINFGGQYPKHKFSAVMWSNNIMPASEGSNICISGLIESYKGIPQIVIRSPENQVSNH